nr:hypothetical protein [Bacteroidales bacterium]
NPYIFSKLVPLIAKPSAMIHVATVHWNTDRWVDLQLNQLNRYIHQPFRVYAFLSGEAAKQRSKYFYSSCQPITEHAVKLNLLAETIMLLAQSDEDPLIFIDGDAFPVTPLDDFIGMQLERYPLAAVQRLENVGDIQPHPSFCLTTVGFWKSISGDWLKGYEWTNSRGVKRTDVGGNLLKILNDLGVEWKPLLRTGQLSEHPLMFGIYENAIYHHGAGFRQPLSMYDRLKPTSHVVKNKAVAGGIDLVLDKLPLKNRFFLQRHLGLKKNILRQNVELSEAIYHDFASIISKGEAYDFISKSRRFPVTGS